MYPAPGPLSCQHAPLAGLGELRSAFAGLHINCEGHTRTLSIANATIRQRVAAPTPPSVVEATFSQPALAFNLRLPSQPGEYILWENAPLDDGAKFYMIESGRVDCFRTFEVRRRSVVQAGDRARYVLRCAMTRPGMPIRSTQSPSQLGCHPVDTRAACHAALFLCCAGPEAGSEGPQGRGRLWRGASNNDGAQTVRHGGLLASHLCCPLRFCACGLASGRACRGAQPALPCCLQLPTRLPTCGSSGPSCNRCTILQVALLTKAPRQADCVASTP